MTQIPCPAHTLSHSLLQSLSDLFSRCSTLFMLTSWSKPKLTPHRAPCLTKAPLPAVWGPSKEGSGGLFLTCPPMGSSSDHQLQPPVALCSLKRSHNFYLYVRFSAIPSTCIILLHLRWLRFHAIFYFPKSCHLFEELHYLQISSFPSFEFPDYYFVWPCLHSALYYNDFCFWLSSSCDQKSQRAGLWVPTVY